MFKSTFLLPAFILLASSETGPANGPTPSGVETLEDAISAKEVLTRMAKTYADCKAYRDSGRVATIFFKGKHRHAKVIDFDTAFVRPGRFRFEYRESQGGFVNQRYIIYRNEATIKSYWTIQSEIRSWENLSMATAAATGVSGTSSHTIPSFLMPDEIKGRRRTDITKPIRLEDALERQVACFCIRGSFGDDVTTLWIGKKDFLLRRIETGHTFKDFRTETTTTYDPVINGEIETKLLKFNVPQD